MNASFLKRATACGVTVSGSLLAVAGALRLDAARELWSAGAWVHADVIGGPYAHQPGIDWTEISDLHGLNAPRLDVHLMVDDPVAACRELPPGLGRITVQVSGDSPIPQIVEAAGDRTEALWLATDESYSPYAVGKLAAESEALDIAGILVMLTPPGQPGKRAGAERIEAVRTLHRTTSLPLGVDGDVNAENFDLVVDAGATYLVIGRGLMSPVSKQTPKRAPEWKNPCDSIPPTPM